MRGWALVADVVEKIVMCGVLVAAVAFPGLHQFHGKAFGARAVAYPLVALLVPAVWLACRRRFAFPVDVDALVTLPFLIDVLGNAFDLYDDVSWWDDANHFVNWAILTAGFGRILVRLPTLSPLTVAGLGIGFGATTAILWELIEYVTFIRNNANELRGAYHDTLGDLALGLLGSTVAAVATAAAVRRPVPQAV